ncbi:MAG: alkaline phosphatase family protein [Cytophagales bacterium]|nr:alkaline phosphatase family protein [Cytophagales bacterium]
MIQKLFISFAALLLNAGFQNVIEAKENKVLIIGIDGCRPDALIEAFTPNIDKLIENGAFTPVATTRPTTSSGPGWSNMLTGVWQNKHGVEDNSFANSNFNSYPHFFNRLKEHDPSLVCASIVRWEPIQSQISKKADIDFNISVTDLAGKIVIQSHRQHGRFASVDISNQVSGVYIVSVNSVYGAEARKLIKQ